MILWAKDQVPSFLGVAIAYKQHVYIYILNIYQYEPLYHYVPCWHITIIYIYLFMVVYIHGYFSWDVTGNGVGIWFIHINTGMLSSGERREWCRPLLERRRSLLNSEPYRATNWVSQLPNHFVVKVRNWIIFLRNPQTYLRATTILGDWFQ